MKVKADTVTDAYEVDAEDTDCEEGVEESGLA